MEEERRAVAPDPSLTDVVGEERTWQPSEAQDLGEGLVLRSVRDERDVERYIAFNRAINGEEEGQFCTRLLRYHPETRRADFQLVEDARTREVVSTTCLIPWVCRYEGIPLRVAMLEMVATHPQYRHRGLVRTQIARFHRLVAERGFDLSIIQGIPYYYRQYGYAYALDHSGADTLPIWRIPTSEGAMGCHYTLREAVQEDGPVLTGLYERAMSEVPIHVARNAEFWAYLIAHVRVPVHILEDRSTGRAGGYVAIRPMKNGQGTQITESAILGMDMAWAAMRAIRARGGLEIRLGWPQEGDLVRLGRSLGSQPLPGYQWLWRIRDVAGLLGKLRPVLDGRLAAAGCSGLTVDVLINLYRDAYRVQIEAGCVASVTPIGFVDASLGADGGDLCIPPEAFVRLALGYRTLDELRDAWPDIVVKAERRPLLDILFPKLISHIMMPY